MIAEGGAWHPDFAADQSLEVVGLVRDGKLTEAGDRYHIARLVAHDDEATVVVLSVLLRQNVLVNTFCAGLWPYQRVPISGAISLVKRIRGDADDNWATFWLDLMNLARLIVYDKPEPYVRVLYNPNELALQKDEAEREGVRGHVINPNTPYGNLLALKEMIGGARQSIRWYEQHMPAKVLNVLYREIDGQKVTSIQLLSGTANIDLGTKDEFKRFRQEMAAERQVEVRWRLLTKDDARVHHGRFFITEGYARNLPPLNSILEGSLDEILPSEITKEQFDELWDLGSDLDHYSPPHKQK